MNFIRSKKQVPTVHDKLRTTYEEIYAAAVDCITLESNARYEEALRGWLTIEYTIEDCMEFLKSSNGSKSHYVKTNDELILLNRIQEVERRCYTEIASLRQLITIEQQQDPHPYVDSPYGQQQMDYFSAEQGQDPPMPPPHRPSAGSSAPPTATGAATPTATVEKRSMIKTLRSSRASRASDSANSSSSASKAATLAWPNGRSSSPVNPARDSQSSQGSSSRASSLGTSNSAFEKLSLRRSNEGFGRVHETKNSLDSKHVSRKPVGSVTSTTPTSSLTQQTLPTVTLAPPAPLLKKPSYSHSPPKPRPPLPSPKPSSLKSSTSSQAATKLKPLSSSSTPASRNSPSPKAKGATLAAAVLATKSSAPAQSAAKTQSPKFIITTPKPAPKPAASTGSKPVTRSTATNAAATKTGQVAKSTKPIVVGDDSKTTKNESEEEVSDWDKKTADIIKNLRGVDENAAKQVLNEIVHKGDEVHWDDIAGLEQAKASLKEAVVYPFLRPDLFSGLREPARGMLLFGPPGTGKTMLARAVATESKSTFFSISASSLTSKFLGESEKLVRALFELSKALAPSIIFVDEIDSLLSQRSDSGEHEASRRIKNEFLIQWSALQSAAAGRETQGDVSRVLVLAATNLPWAIDEAARRRFVRRQYIPLPERDTRLQHLKKLMEHQNHAIDDGGYEVILEKTEGFSGSDMTALAKDAAMGPLRSLGEALLTTPRDQIRPIGVQDFIASLKSIRPSVSVDGLKDYEEWATLYGSSGA